MNLNRLYHCFRISLMRDGFERAAYLKRKKIFAKQGDNCFWQPRNIPPEAKLIKLGNNVVVASEVLFVTHDVIHNVLKNVDPEGNHYLNLGAIEIENNVFIGSRSVVLPNVKIQSNVIIGAGSLVVSDIREGVVVGGVPAKEIGSFDKLLKMRRGSKIERRRKEERFSEEWANFYKQRRIRE